MPKWLLKTEPESYSIDDLKRDKTTLWDGVRNYQARNFMQTMEPGDLCLFYHSNASPPHVAGIAKVSKRAQPDPTQFDTKSKYHDPKATREKPRWFCPEIRFVRKFRRPVPLDRLRAKPALAAMELLRKGSRLSVQPVAEDEFDLVCALADETGQ